MINYWLSVNESIYADTILYAQDSDNYSGSHPFEDVQALTNRLYDPITVLSMFKPYQSKRLLTVYVSDQDVFDGLLNKYSDTVILGGWDMEGNQLLPVHSAMVNHMPISELADVNLVGGQQRRLVPMGLELRGPRPRCRRTKPVELLDRHPGSERLPRRVVASGRS